MTTEPRGRRLGRGGEPWLQWTRRRDVWTSDVEDSTLTYLGPDQYRLAHGAESGICECLAGAMITAQMHRAMQPQ